MVAGGFRVVGLHVVAAFDGKLVSGGLFSMGRGAANCIAGVMAWEDGGAGGVFLVVGLQMGAALDGTLVSRG